MEMLKEITHLSLAFPKRQTRAPISNRNLENNYLAEWRIGDSYVNGRSLQLNQRAEYGSHYVGSGASGPALSEVAISKMQPMLGKFIVSNPDQAPGCRLVVVDLRGARGGLPGAGETRRHTAATKTASASAGAGSVTVSPSAGAGSAASLRALDLHFTYPKEMRRFLDGVYSATCSATDAARLVALQHRVLNGDAQLANQPNSRWRAAQPYVSFLPSNLIEKLRGPSFSDAILQYHTENEHMPRDAAKVAALGIMRGWKFFGDVCALVDIHLKGICAMGVAKFPEQEAQDKAEDDLTTVGPELCFEGETALPNKSTAKFYTKGITMVVNANGIDIYNMGERTPGGVDEKGLPRLAQPQPPPQPHHKEAAAPIKPANLKNGGGGLPPAFVDSIVKGAWSHTLAYEAVESVLFKDADTDSTSDIASKAVLRTNGCDSGAAPTDVVLHFQSHAVAREVVDAIWHYGASRMKSKHPIPKCLPKSADAADEIRRPACSDIRGTDSGGEAIDFDSGAATSARTGGSHTSC